MAELTEGEIFGVIGEDGFRRLIAAFYQQVPLDPVLGPMYPPDELQAAEQRLGGFLIQRFGGPDDYSQARGHPRLRMRHAPFVIDFAARQHWMKMMTAALDQMAFPPDVRGILERYFAATATSMMNQPI